MKKPRRKRGEKAEEEMLLKIRGEIKILKERRRVDLIKLQALKDIAAEKPLTPLL